MIFNRFFTKTKRVQYFIRTCFLSKIKKKIFLMNYIQDQKTTKDFQNADFIMMQISKVNPLYKNFAFISDLNMYRFHSTKIAIFFFIILHIFIIANALSSSFLINQNLFPESDISVFYIIREIFCYTTKTDPNDLYSFPPFYIGIFIILCAVISSYAIIKYQYSLNLNYALQLFIYIFSEILGPIFLYVISLSASTGFIKYAYSKVPELLAMPILEAFCLPVFILLSARAVCDVRLVKYPYTSVNIRMTFISMGFYVFDGIVTSYLEYVTDNTFFRVFALIVVFLFGLSITVLTIREPFFYSQLSQIFASVTASILSFYSLFSLIMFFFQSMSITSYGIIMGIGSLVFALFMVFFNVIMTKKAEALLDSLYTVDPKQLSHSKIKFLLFVASLKDDQEKFGTKFTEKIAESYPGDIDLLTFALSYKLGDKNAYKLILKEATTFISMNSSNFLSALRLKAIASVASGDTLLVNNKQALSIRTLNLLLAPCYKALENIWRSSVCDNMTTMKKALLDLQSYIDLYGPFFEKRVEFIDSLKLFRRTISYKLKGYDPDETTTFDQIEKCIKAEDYNPPRVKALKTIFTIGFILVICVCAAQILTSLVLSMRIVSSPKLFQEIIDIYSGVYNITLALTYWKYGNTINSGINTNLSAVSANIVSSFNNISNNTFYASFFSYDVIEHMKDTALNSLEQEFGESLWHPNQDAINAYTSLKNDYIILLNQFVNTCNLYRTDLIDDIDANYRIFIFTSIIMAILFIVFEILLIVIIKNIFKIYEQACWQPMLLPKQISINMMHYYTKMIDMLSKVSSRKERFANFGPTGIILISFIPIPLTILISYCLFLITDDQVNTYHTASVLTLATPFIAPQSLFLPLALGDLSSTNSAFSYIHTGAIYLDILNQISTGASSNNFTTELSLLPESDIEMPILDLNETASLQSELTENVLYDYCDSCNTLSYKLQNVLNNSIETPEPAYETCFISLCTMSDYIFTFNNEISQRTYVKISFGIFLLILIVVIYFLVLMLTFLKLWKNFTLISKSINLIQRILSFAPTSAFYEGEGMFLPPPESHLQDIIDAFPNGIIFVDKQGTIISANEKAIEIFGDIIGLNKSVLQSTITGADGEKKFINLQFFEAHSFPTNFFDAPNTNDFIIATDLTNIKTIEMKVKMLKNELERDFTLPPLMRQSGAVSMREIVVLDISLDVDTTTDKFNAFVKKLRAESENLQTLFYLDTQRWSTFAIFYTSGEKMRRFQQIDALNLAIATAKALATYNIRGKQSIAFATGVTAVVENSSAPRVYLCGSNMWKAANLLKHCHFGYIIAEKSIAMKFADITFEVIQYGNTVSDNEDVEYAIIKPDFPTPT